MFQVNLSIKLLYVLLFCHISDILLMDLKAILQLFLSLPSLLGLIFLPKYRYDYWCTQRGNKNEKSCNSRWWIRRNEDFE
jgi:hypothetical protein